MHKYIRINKEQADIIFSKGLERTYFKYILGLLYENETPGFMHTLDRFLLKKVDGTLATDISYNKSGLEDIALSDDVFQFWSDNERTINKVRFVFKQEMDKKKRIQLKREGKTKCAYAPNMYVVYSLAYGNNVFNDRVAFYLYAYVYTAFCIKNNIVPSCFYEVEQIMIDAATALVDNGMQVLTGSRGFNKDVVLFLRFNYNEEDGLGYSVLKIPSTDGATYLTTRGSGIKKLWSGITQK